MTVNIESCPIDRHRWKTPVTPKSVRLLALLFAKARGMPITEESATQLLTEYCRGGTSFSVAHELAALQHHGALELDEKVGDQTTYRLASKEAVWILLGDSVEKAPSPAHA